VIHKLDDVGRNYELMAMIRKQLPSDDKKFQAIGNNDKNKKFRLGFGC